MPRYILIDNETGYIFGDTANLPGDHIFTRGEWAGSAARDVTITPVVAAQWLDESEVRKFGRHYDDLTLLPLASNETGYHVYRADVGGSDAVAVAHDGQDQEAIEAVQKNCEYVTAIRCSDTV